MARGRSHKPTLKAKEALPVRLLFIWTEELEYSLIAIQREYIDSGKLADNVFKKTDYTVIVEQL